MNKELEKDFSAEPTLASSVENLHQRIIKRLKTLPAGTTMCPGRLARDCGTVLSQIRGNLLELALSGEIRISQKGKAVSPQGLRGPFRVSLQTSAKSKRAEK
jgi:hypothetical protein